jgi:hypothetical protein
VQKYLKRVGPYIQAYEQGAEYKYFAPRVVVDGPTLFDVLLPHLEASRWFTELHLVIAWGQENGIEKTRFFRKMETALKHTKHISQGPSLVERLAALREKISIYDAMLAALEVCCICKEDLQEIDSLLTVMRDEKLCYTLVRSVPAEMAGAYSLLQDITLVGHRKPGFDEKRVGYWLEVLGCASPSRSTVVRKLMSEKPTEISRSIESYYKRVWAILESSCWSTESNSLAQVFKEYQSRHAYFTAFPLTSYSGSYDKFLGAERRRRIAVLGLALWVYKYGKNTFPEGLSELGGCDTEITDPVTKRAFQYRKVERGAIIEAKLADGFPNLKVDMPL